MTTVNPYLTFNGNCEEAFEFYKSVFGGEFASFGRFEDMPPPEEGEAPSAAANNKIMHVSLPISRETTLMGSDLPPHMQAIEAGKNVSTAIGVDSKELADKLFNGLSAGGKITMPIADMFWGDYFGMFTDKFGFHWMVSFEKKSEK